MAVIRDYIDGLFRDEGKEEVGIGGFTTLVRTRERYVRSSTVPTTFLEDGTHINDHIIRNPLAILIEGNVSDVYVKPSPLMSSIRRVLTNIGIITQYVPERTEAQVSKVTALTNDFLDALDKVDAMINDGQQLEGFLGLIGQAQPNNINAFIDDMEAHYYGDYLISIDMPSRKYTNMRITTLEVERDNEQNALTFRLEAQQLRFADSVFALIEPAPNPSEGLDGQTLGEADKGIQEGSDVPQSFLNWFLSKIG